MKKRLLAFLLTLLMLLTLLPVSAGAADKKLVALTFDDGPGPYTAGLLDGLKARGVNVTFFMQGASAATYPAIVKRAYDEGHQIACHTYNHPTLTTLSDAEVRSQITRTTAVLDKAIGTTNSYILRPPYGDYNSRVLRAVGVPAILWSVDPLDWKYRNSTTVYQNITKAAYDGAVILVHDIHATTIPGALNAIDTLKNAGYEFVTVNELFRRRGKTLNVGSIYTDCKKNGTDLPALTAPSFTLGDTLNGKLVTMQADSGVKIYYTTDGSAPTATSPVYDSRLVVEKDATVRAVAAGNMNGSRSAESQIAVTVKQVKTPVIRIQNGMASIADTGNPIYITTDGSDPDFNSAGYREPFAVQPGTTVKAMTSPYGVSGGGVIASAYCSLRGNAFTDISPENWFFDQVDEAVSRGLISAYEDGSFRPYEAMTRGMAVAMLRRMSGDTAEYPACTFTDVPADSYFAAPAAWGVANGVVHGYTDNTFRPGAPMTRQEFAVLLAAYLKGDTTGMGQGLTFTDRDEVEYWAKDAVGYLSSRGLLLQNALGAYGPTCPITRSETAQILLKLAKG